MTETTMPVSTCQACGARKAPNAAGRMECVSCRRKRGRDRYAKFKPVSRLEVHPHPRPDASGVKAWDWTRCYFAPGAAVIVFRGLPLPTPGVADAVAVNRFGRVNYRVTCRGVTTTCALEQLLPGPLAVWRPGDGTTVREGGAP